MEGDNMYIHTYIRVYVYVYIYVYTHIYISKMYLSIQGNKEAEPSFFLACFQIQTEPFAAQHSNHKHTPRRQQIGNTVFTGRHSCSSCLWDAETVQVQDLQQASRAASFLGFLSLCSAPLGAQGMMAWGENFRYRIVRWKGLHSCPPLRIMKTFTKANSMYT